MALRVKADDVLEIIDTDLDEGIIRNSMITIASNYIDVHLASAGHSAATLKHIELYLAAHFVAITEEKGGIVEDEFADAKVKFSDVYADGFNSTRYGQMAINLDTSGNLARLSTTKLKATFRVI